MKTRLSPDGLLFPMQRGPFQNSGASPWYTTLALGTPGQPLKLAMDTGTNINWVTSTLCPADHCQHFSAGRFDYQASATFAFTDCQQRPYSFGPWGTMLVETGTDTVALPDGASIAMDLFLAADYTGDQFRQLDWDGGIGLPASSAWVEERSSFLFQTLLHDGQLDPTQPYVCFDWNPDTQKGSCRMGGFDRSKARGPHLFLPWSPYSKEPTVQYLWSARLCRYSVGGETLASDITFALDSGSSRFKGDARLMRQTLERIGHGACPDVVLEFADGEITLGADLYNVLIEQGPQQGQALPQFAPLPLADLVLAGSVVMEHCYTIHEYQVMEGSPGVYTLAPVGIWLFNRPDGPQIITGPSSRAFPPGQDEIATPSPALPVECASVAGTWVNDYGSLMTLSVSGQHVSGLYQSSTGSTGQYEVTGYQLGTQATPQLGLPVALAIEWHSIGEGPADPSWNWSSGLCGQLNLIGHEDVLELSHILVASSDFAGQTTQGKYLDKLTYRRTRAVQHQPRSGFCVQECKSTNILAGLWEAADGARLELSVEAARQGRFGRVCGGLTMAGGHTDICGFTDINASRSGLSLQSLAMTAAHKDRVMTLCGALDTKDDVLELLILTGTRTAPAQAYVQTQISSTRFRRVTR